MTLRPITAFAAPQTSPSELICAQCLPLQFVLMIIHAPVDDAQGFEYAMHWKGFRTMERRRKTSSSAPKELQ
jgi:hypothetical protein